MRTYLEKVAGPIDGRNIDPELGLLEGEGALQRVRAPVVARPPWRVLQETPSKAFAQGPTYYGLPLLKEHVWIWSVPAYFWVGGITGASSVLAAVAQASGDERLRPLVAKAHWTATIGSALSAALLVHDLGRPTRFHHMLRVFRPTSPMNLGAWILSLSGALSGASALFADREGVVGRLASASGYGAALFGVALAGYGGVLLANTAVPVWQSTHRELPVLFLSSAVASAGATLELLPVGEHGRKVARRFGNLGKAAELVSSFALQRAASKVVTVGRPLHHGLSGTMWRAAKVLTLTSLAMSLWPTRRRWVKTAAALIANAGSLSMRFAITRAGKASARDPRASFDQQRAGWGGAAVEGRAARIGPPPERPRAPSWLSPEPASERFAPPSPS